MNESAKMEEQIKLAALEALISGNGTIASKEDLEVALINYIGSGNYNLLPETEKGYTVEVDEKIYIISTKGNITVANYSTFYIYDEANQIVAQYHFTIGETWEEFINNENIIFSYRI